MKDRERGNICKRLGVCVMIKLREREREREKERGRDREIHIPLTSLLFADYEM